MERTLSADALLAHLRERVATEGNNALAKTLQCSPQFISDICKGKRALGQKVAHALGYEGEMRYKKIS